MSILFKHKINWTYAIGEIILVVVGILIALQIDNWNEGLKKSRFEQSLLVDLQKDLIVDTTLLSVQINRIENMLAAARFLTEMPPYEDSFQYILGRLEEGVLFTPQDASFETLKSVGMDVIRDNELRRSILGLYRTYDFHVSIVGVSQEEFFNHVWIPFARQYLVHQVEKDQQFENSLVPRDYNSMTTNSDYVDVLNWKLSWYGEYQMRFAIMKESAQSTISDIKNHLASR